MIRRRVMACAIAETVGQVDDVAPWSGASA